MVSVLKVLWNSLAEVLKILGAGWTAHSTRYFGMKSTTFDGDFLTSDLPSSGPPRRLGALSNWCFPRLPSRGKALGCECQSANRPENEGKRKRLKTKCTRRVVGRERPAKREDKTEVKAAETLDYLFCGGRLKRTRDWDSRVSSGIQGCPGPKTRRIHRHEPAQISNMIDAEQIFILLT